MSKKIFTILLTAFVFVCLTGCTPAKPDPAKTFEGAETIDVVHMVGGFLDEWSEEGEDAKASKNGLPD